MNMQVSKIDVAVVGGGPGGLAAAIALSKAAALRVAVFERFPVLTRRGAGLGLDVNGQKAIRAIKPEVHNEILSISSFLQTSRNQKADGTLVSESPLASQSRTRHAEQGYKTPCLVGWSELRDVLYNQLPDKSSVFLGTEFDRYEEDESSGLITVHFRNGQPPVQASLLVAADGYFSRVRRQCVADGPPDYGKTIMWRARLSAAAAMDAGFDLTGRCDMVMDLGRFIFLYPISSGDVVWTAAATDDKLAECGINAAELLQQMRSGSSSSSAATNNSSTAEPDYTAQETQGYSKQEIAKGEAAKARCLQALAGFMDPVHELIKSTPAGSLVEHGVYVRPAASVSADSFGKGRVVIIGDAAHPVRPTGQGLNQTIEDCWGLGKALLGAASGADISLTALQQFREQRAARIKPIIAYTQATGEAAYKSKGLQDRQAAGSAAQQPDTPQMTAAQFEELCYSIEFECLDELRQQQQGEVAGVV